PTPSPSPPLSRPPTISAGGAVENTAYSTSVPSCRIPNTAPARSTARDRRVPGSERVSTASSAPRRPKAASSTSHCPRGSGIPGNPTADAATHDAVNPTILAASLLIALPSAQVLETVRRPGELRLHHAQPVLDRVARGAPQPGSVLPPVAADRLRRQLRPQRLEERPHPLRAEERVHEGQTEHQPGHAAGDILRRDRLPQPRHEGPPPRGRRREVPRRPCGPAGLLPALDPAPGL